MVSNQPSPSRRKGRRLCGAKTRAGGCRSLAALYLRKFTDELPQPAIEPHIDGFTLRFKPQAALTLLVG